MQCQLLLLMFRINEQEWGFKSPSSTEYSAIKKGLIYPKTAYFNSLTSQRNCIFEILVCHQCEIHMREDVKSLTSTKSWEKKFPTKDILL